MYMEGDLPPLAEYYTPECPVDGSAAQKCELMADQNSVHV